MAQKKRPVTKSGRPRARKGVKLEPTELAPPQLALAERPPELDALAARDRGATAARCSPPTASRSAATRSSSRRCRSRRSSARRSSATSPTPHVRKLTLAMDKTRRYLDPIIVVRERDRWLTPNGGHRLTALKELGARSVLALVVPEKQVAYQILALNIEKAHNLREKALEVVRMYRDLADTVDPQGERDGARVRGAGARHARLRVRGARRGSRAAPTRPILQEGGRASSTRSSPRRSPSASGARGWCSSSTTRSSEAVARLKEQRLRLAVPQGTSSSRA